MENYDERGMPIEEYMSLIKPEIVSEVDYGKWINFEESYPPLKDKPYNGVYIEILHKGDPYFNCIFHDGKGSFFVVLTGTTICLSIETLITPRTIGGLFLTRQEMKDTMWDNIIKEKKNDYANRKRLLRL